MSVDMEPTAFSQLPRTFRPFDPMKDGAKVAICICNNHAYMPDSYFWTYLHMMKPSGYHAVKGEASTKCGSLNEATAKALHVGAEWLFFTDVDMTFPPDALRRLLSHNLPIVSGLYHLGKVPYSPVAGWAMPDPEVMCGFRFVNQYDRLWRYNYAPFPKGLVEVDWVGAGCLLVHRDVLLDIGWPAWADKWKEGYGQRLMGHDANLCLRAKAAGHKVFVDADVNCGHWRMQEVERNFAEAMYTSDFAAKVVEGVKLGAKEPRYWDELWLREHGSKHVRAPFYRAEHDYILSHLSEGDSVIDFGAGPGEFLDRASKERRCATSGIDFSREAVDIMCRRGHFGVRADLRTFETNGSTGKFDAAVCNHSLEHIEDDNRLVRVMSEHVRPGGKVLASVPVATDEDLPAADEHVRDYTPETLAALFSKYLTNVTITAHGHSYVAVGTKAVNPLAGLGNDPCAQYQLGTKP